MISEIPKVHDKIGCKTHVLAIKDTLDLVGGKWKLPILFALGLGTWRFKELQREIEGITAKMLSKELKELEINELVKREVFATTPVTVEYSLTDYGKTISSVINPLHDWGMNHRERIIKGKK